MKNLTEIYMKKNYHNNSDIFQILIEIHENFIGFVSTKKISKKAALTLLN